MSKKILDCKGLACPMPVIMTKKELESIETDAIEVTVDNLTAKENLIKLGKSMNIKSEVMEKDGQYIVTLCKEKQATSQALQNESRKDLPQNADMKQQSQKASAEVVLITSEFLGRGDDELGKILMKGFIYTLSETAPYPKKILFLNSGVKLTTHNEEAIANLKKLEDTGAEILSCGTCLDFYHVKENLKVGKVANMYDIVEALKSTTDKFIV